MLAPAELRLLGRLDLAYRRPQHGLYAGERRSPHSARSPEFADFRAYVPGDDYRQIDWKAYARLEKLTLRQYVAEEEACLNLVLDDSRSMTLGQPDKWTAARRVAAALAFIGLRAMDRVLVGTLGGRRQAPCRGREAVPRTWSFLLSLEATAASGPAEITRLGWLRPGLTVVISDCLHEGGDWAAPLAGLRARRQEPVLWQVLAAEEETPALLGDVKLVDVESDRGRELTVTQALLDDYGRALDRHREALTRAGRAAGGRFLHTTSGDDLDTAMASGLRAGVLRRG
ncbi:MAG: DUF58 domain-containing protein [Candidatus Dormibacteraeota bacterium]|nr:DUF58 domain-containing protein [Candidatus Dormibacteraeota bacterium]